MSGWKQFGIGLVIVGLLVRGQIDARAADWPHIGFDAARTSANPHEHRIGPSNVADLEIQWTHRVSSTVRGGVSVVNGVAYYGTYGGDFRAVDAATGEVLWTRRLSGKSQGQAVADGVAYVTASCVGGSCGQVYAFDATTGALRWTRIAPDQRLAGPVIADSVVYFGSYSPTPTMLYALDARTGNGLWHVPSGGANLAVEKGVVYASSSDTNALHARDAADGTLLWTANTDGSALSGPAVSDGIVYVHSTDGYLYAFDADGCGAEMCPPLWIGTTGEAVAEGPQRPAVGEGAVFAGVGNRLYAFDTAGCGEPPCTPRWSATTECWFFPSSSPSVANGVVYSTCGNSYLYAFDASTGETLWQFYTRGSGYPMRSTPTIVNGQLYHMATFDFTLYVFRAPCTADVNGDGLVDLGDLDALLVAWGPCEGECPEDLDEDGDVGVSDLLELLLQWGSCA